MHNVWAARLDRSVDTGVWRQTSAEGTHVSKAGALLRGVQGRSRSARTSFPEIITSSPTGDRYRRIQTMRTLGQAGGHGLLSLRSWAGRKLRDANVPCREQGSSPEQLTKGFARAVHNYNFRPCLCSFARSPSPVARLVECLGFWPVTE